MDAKHARRLELCSTKCLEAMDRGNKSSILTNSARLASLLSTKPYENMQKLYALVDEMRGRQVVYNTRCRGECKDKQRCARRVYVSVCIWGAYMAAHDNIRGRTKRAENVVRIVHYMFGFPELFENVRLQKVMRTKLVEFCFEENMREVFEPYHVLLFGSLPSPTPAC